MSNKVSFIIQLRDQFRKNARKIKQDMKDIKRETDKADASVRKLSLSFKKGFSSIKKNAKTGGLALTAAITTPFVLSTKSMIQAASDAVETKNKFGEVFKGINKQANEMSSGLAKSLGLAGSTSQELLSNTGDLLVGLGLTREQSLRLSADVLTLSADVASFKNVQGGAERASIALTKAMLGEREMLKETFKTAVLETEVKKKAIMIRRKDRTLTEQQAKAMAVLAIVAERNRDAAGDLNRTWNDYANVARRNAEKTKEMKEAFGTLLLPIATKVVIALTKMVTWLNNLSPGMKKFILILGGLLAVAGPLLLVVGGIAAAFALISGPVALVVGGILAVTAAIAALVAYWDDIKAIFSKIGGVISNSSAVKFVTKILSTEGKNRNPRGAPFNSGGKVSGNISVSAAPGSKVESTKMTNKGPGLNIGMNMVTQ